MAPAAEPLLSRALGVTCRKSSALDVRWMLQTGMDATKKLPGEGFKRPWPPLIKMDVVVKAKVEKLFNLRKL